MLIFVINHNWVGLRIKSPSNLEINTYVYQLIQTCFINILCSVILVEYVILLI